jgi:phosphonate transport system substrate-binding protein
MTRVIFLSLLLTCCTHDQGKLGTKNNPVKIFFVPSVDAKVIEETASAAKKFLENSTPYKFKTVIPTSFIAVVEAFGTGRADIASINLFGYMLAHDKYEAEARLTLIRYGETTYKAMILARVGGKIRTLDDINGMKFAFVDPASVSGYLLPLKIFKDRQIKPKETVFAMTHDNVVSMIYQGQVDAGAAFYSPPEKGEIQDARRLVKTQFPDVEEKVKIVELTLPIPNDPIIFRKSMPQEMKKIITDALIKFSGSPEGKVAMEKWSSVNGLVPATDKDYDSVRAMLKSLGKSATELVK